MKWGEKQNAWWFGKPQPKKEIPEDEVVRLPELTSQERIRLFVELPAHPSMMDIQDKTIEILQRRVR